MRINLFLSAAILSVSAVAAVSQQNVAAFYRVGTQKTIVPLQVQGSTVGNYAPMGFKTIKKAPGIARQDAFAYRAPIRRAAGLRHTPLKPASSYSMPAYGVVVFSDSWYAEAEAVSHVGMYEIPTFGTPTSFHLIKESYDLAGSGGCVYANGKFFSAVPDIDPSTGIVTDMNYYIFNTETWDVETTMPGDINFFATALTYDPTSERVFGCFVNSEEQYYYFGSLDITTGQITEIKNYNVDVSYSGMAASPSGILYAMSSDGYFYTVDKRTGDYKMVGSNGICSDYITSAAIDPKTGKMYYVATTDSSSDLFEIDTATGNANYVYHMPGNEQVLGLFIPSPDVDGGAPAVASEISAVFEGGSLSGQVKFTAPLLNYNNIPGTGEISYTVMLNGTVAATGATTYGAQGSADVTAPAAGNYTIAVAFANAAGQGPIATAHVYIGPDEPTKVKNVLLDYADGSLVLTWDTPSAVNGGFIDLDKVTYQITRFPDQKVVAAAHKGTRFTEPMAEPESQVKYSYAVAATYEGKTSEAVSSNVYALGSFNPPYRASFDIPADLDDFTIVDANNDGKTWEYVNGEIKITYNASEPANDYLILPPMKLEAGKTYALSFDVKAQWVDAIEKVAVYVGSAPTAEALTTTLLAPTNVSWDSYQTREVFYAPQASGTYFFAIKGCSEAGRFYLCVDNVYLSAAMNADSPAVPSDLTVVPGQNGAYTADLTFNAPTTTISGKALTSIDHIEITRNGKAIAQLQGTPGEVVKYTDNEPENGNNDYGVAAVNASGKGAEAHATVYVGVFEPEKIETLTAMRNIRNPGNVNLGWDAVTVDVKGNPLASSQVRYYVYRWMRGVTEVVADGINTTSFQDSPCGRDDAQQFVYYGVSAATAAGEGEITESELVAVGAPYAIPYTESYPNAGMSHIFGMEADEYAPADWVGCTDQTFQDMTAQDNDNGYLTCYSQWGTAYATLYSGYILIENATNPELTFYYYDYDSSNEFDVQINSGNGFRTVKTVKLGAGQGWTKCTVSLGAFIDMEIQYALDVKLLGTMSVSFDNFRVGSRLEHNLVADGITATPVVNAGDNITIDVTVKNDGRNAADKFSVELYRDGRLVATKDGGPLYADGVAVVSFVEQATPVFAEETEYHAVVKYAADEFDGDNTTAKTMVAVKLPNHPVVTGLTAKSNEVNVDLAWAEPDFDAIKKVVTVDGAEDYRTFSIGLPTSEFTGDKIGDWTMVDADGFRTYGIGVSGTDQIYQYANASQAMAFQVFSVDEVGLNNPKWNAYSGKKMFVSFASEPDVANKKGNDDWMISPALSGDAQTVSFYAKSVDTRYGNDEFEVFYSMGGTDIKEFVKLGNTLSTTESWQAFAFELPEGAKHFAIRCISYDRFAFCVDEVSYVAADAQIVELSLLGYNVYRNGMKVNSAPVEDQVYTDMNVPAGRHEYHVTALYTVGESRPSDVARVDHLSGLENITMPEASVKVVGGTIVIAGAEGQRVAVHTVDGRTVFATEAASTVNVTVAPAIYLVTAGSRTIKVVVR